MLNTLTSELGIMSPVVKPVARRGLPKEFPSQLVQILKILFPSATHPSSLLLLSHTASLVCRTLLSIAVAGLDGAIVQSLVRGRPRQFFSRLGLWLVLAVPATFVNSMIRFLESRLALSFRTRLSEHLYARYMRNEVYYKVLNLDDRVQNVDQCLTEDVAVVTSMIAHLHSQVSKPVLDVVLMVVRLVTMALARRTGSAGVGRVLLLPTAVGFGAVLVTSQVLKFAAPPFGALAKRQAELEGVLRFVHSRVIGSAEEIAFYGGHAVELTKLRAAYRALTEHLHKVFRARVFYTMVEQFCMKYGWSCIGQVIVAIPAFIESAELKRSGADSNSGDAASERTGNYITARSLLIHTADAIERIMGAYKDVTELSGYTSRVTDLMATFEAVERGEFRKAQVGAGADSSPAASGVVEEGDRISLEAVPIVSPTGEVLVPSLTMAIEPGQHTLISGPNGCGKSSLFRMIGGLWPVPAGHMVRPPRSQVFFVPQKPYLPLGSLREQVIYPLGKDQHLRAGAEEGDRRVMEALEWVALVPIVTREGGLDATNDWGNVLSGGEKQRIAMARLFFHRPRFAVLDECTSATSIDIEGKMYDKAIELGITLLTVSHRQSLWKYHTHHLKFDGESGWAFGKMSH
jgi:ATP-binding cassette subfamily D (ALD) protein 2